MIEPLTDDEIKYLREMIRRDKEWQSGENDVELDDDGWGGME